MFRGRNTKILATLGPATSSKEIIEAIIVGGVDAIRLNMSHGKKDDHAKLIALIREIEHELGRPIAILVDLQGPKIRIGSFAEADVTVETGQTFRLDSDPTPGNADRVQLPHPELFGAIAEGAEILLNDGRVRLITQTVGAD